MRKKERSTGGTLPAQDATFARREEQWQHMPYERELQILDLVRCGDVDGLRELRALRQDTLDFHQHMADDPLRQRKYELVALTTLVTRWAVEGGLDVETAYSLADDTIRAADRMKSQKDVIELLVTVPESFAARVRAAKRGKIHSRIVMRCIEYIDSNLHYRITLDDMAAYAGRTASYISFLFHEETGSTIKQYILQRRLDVAQRQLLDTDMPISQIAVTNGFRSQQYFSTLFRSQMGETPNQYRNRMFRRHTSGEDTAEQQNPTISGSQ